MNKLKIVDIFRTVKVFVNYDRIFLLTMVGFWVKVILINVTVDGERSSL